jgi:hypothetical protein
VTNIDLYSFRPPAPLASPELAAVADADVAPKDPLLAGALGAGGIEGAVCAIHTHTMEEDAEEDKLNEVGLGLFWGRTGLGWAAWLGRLGWIMHETTQLSLTTQLNPGEATKTNQP